MAWSDFEQYRLTPDAKLYRKLEIQDVSGTWQDVTEYWVDPNRLNLEWNLESYTTLTPREGQVYFTLCGDFRDTYQIGDAVRISVYFDPSDTYIVFEGEISKISYDGKTTSFIATEGWLTPLQRRRYNIGYVINNKLIPVWTFRHLRDYFGVVKLDTLWNYLRDYFKREDDVDRVTPIEFYPDLVDSIDIARVLNTSGVLITYIKDEKLYCEWWVSPIGPSVMSYTEIGDAYSRVKILNCDYAGTLDPCHKSQILVYDPTGTFRIYRWDFTDDPPTYAYSNSSFPNVDWIPSSMAYQGYNPGDLLDYWWCLGINQDGDLCIYSLDSTPAATVRYTVAPSGGFTESDYQGCAADGVDGYYFTEYRLISGTDEYFYAIVYRGSTNDYTRVDAPNTSGGVMRTYEREPGDYYAVTKYWWIRYTGNLCECDAAYPGWGYSGTPLDCAAQNERQIIIYNVEPVPENGNFQLLYWETTTYELPELAASLNSPSLPKYGGKAELSNGEEFHLILGRAANYRDWYLFFDDADKRYFQAEEIEDPYTSDLDMLTECGRASLFGVAAKQYPKPYFVKVDAADHIFTVDDVKKDSFRIHEEAKFDSIAIGEIVYPTLGNKPLSLTYALTEKPYEKKRYLRFLWRNIFKHLRWIGEFEGRLLIEADILDRIEINIAKVTFDYTPEIYIDGLTYRLPDIQIRTKLLDIDPDLRLYYAFEEGNLPAPTGIEISTGSGSLSHGYYYYRVQAFDGVVWSPLSVEVWKYCTSSCQITVSWNAVPGAQKYRVWRGTTAGGENEYYDTTETSITDDGSLDWTSGTPSENDLLYVYDYSRCFNHGTPNDIKSIDGKYGVMLNGTSSYIDAGANATRLREFTILVACKITKRDATQVIIHRGQHEDSGYHIYNHYDSGAGTNTFRFRVIGEALPALCTSEAVFDELVTLAMTYKSKEGGAAYVNGDEVGTIEDVGDVDYTHDSNVGIGANIYGTPSLFFGGEIYEVRIIGRKYSQSEIQKWHNEIKRKFG